MTSAMGGAFTLPGFEVQTLLGFGATGEVWQARELATDDTVALKRLRPGADRAAVDILRREASLLRTLDTPYVVRLRAVVGDGDDVVLVLDHAGGGSLSALLTRRGCLDPGEVVTIAGPLAAALAVAHEQGLVHGDVSPANVLFTADGMPLLSDLGVARTAGERFASVDGTAEYVDPAVAAGGDPDEAADVWALAAVCHHMLAGSPPHEGQSAEAVLTSAVDGGRAPLGLLAPSAPRALVAAVEAGLVRDPAGRPDAAGFASLVRRSFGTAPVRLTGAATSAVLAEPRPTTSVRSWAAEPDAPARRRWLPFGRGGVATRGQRPHARPPEHAGRFAVLRSPTVRGPALLVLLVAVAAVAGWWSGRGVDAGAAVAAPARVVASDRATTPGAAIPTRPASASASPSPSAAASPAPPLASVVVPADLSTRPVAEQVEALTSVLRALDDSRAQAFASAEARQLDAVSVAGSPALEQDRQLVEALREQGRTAHGVRHELQAVEVLSVTASTARLRVEDALAGYEIRSADAVVGVVAARGPRAHLVELRRGDAGWRLVEITGL